MEELNKNELLYIEGGSNVGNALLVAGGIILSISTAGTAGIALGAGISIFGYLSSME